MSRAWRFGAGRCILRPVRVLVYASFSIVIGLCAVWQLRAAADSEATAAVAPSSGAALYDRFCLACHGAEGDGAGPASPWVWPRPRDFVRGEFKWRSTGSGKPPTDADLATAIRYGVPGTSMHGFGASLSEADIAALIDVIKSFKPRKFRRDATPLALSAPAGDRAALAARGADLYQSLGCAKCHGDGGEGDGPSAAELESHDGAPALPYDLTREPLRRPRAPGTDGALAIYASLVTGLDGTPMPSYQGAAPPEDLFAVALHVDGLRAPDLAFPPMNGSSVIADAARKLDRERRLSRTGYYPGGDPAAAVLFGGPIMPQGPAPAKLAPAQASLDARQCARCHDEQYRAWRGSIHAAAGSPGLIAQLLPMEAHGKGATIESCQRCHTPLAEQAPFLSPAQRGGGEGYEKNPAYDPALREQGLSCAGCHVRGWHRFGPARIAADLLGLPGYPRTELAVYERADFCLPCHQLTAASGVNGKPLLNTYKEWLEGPYMRRGVQCQHCHMPNRDHSWKGVHDAETFRQGFDIEGIARRSATTGAVSVRARMKNVGAGHYLPTTPTPAAFIAIELVDEGGEIIEGARSERRVGRHLVFRDGRFQELEDTRIPPGESFEIAGAWQRGRVAEATHAIVTVRVEPDEYYERLYRRRLDAEIGASERRLFRDALDRATSSHYVAETLRVPIR